MVSLVELKSGWVLIGKLAVKAKEQASKKNIQLIRRHPDRFRTITSDNDTKFYGYAEIEQDQRALQFRHPAPGLGTWNTKGLIRQYLPEGMNMANLTQRRCDQIAKSTPDPGSDMSTRPRIRSSSPPDQRCTSRLMLRVTLQELVNWLVVRKNLPRVNQASAHLRTPRGRDSPCYTRCDTVSMKRARGPSR